MKGSKLLEIPTTDMTLVFLSLPSLASLEMSKRPKKDV